MKALKFTSNLLSLITISLMLYLLNLFLGYISIGETVSQYMRFSYWFWSVAMFLILLNTFTEIQIIFEDSLSRFKFFKNKSE